MLVTEFVRPEDVRHIRMNWLEAYYFVRDNIRYRPDPFWKDSWQYPLDTLSSRQGDCEDKATLLCSILLANGYRSYCRIAYVEHNGGKREYHVYVLVHVLGKWVPLDPSCQACPPGILGFRELKTILDFNNKEIIVHDPREAEDFIKR